LQTKLGLSGEDTSAESRLAQVATLRCAAEVAHISQRNDMAQAFQVH
jgi:hypothetical protein